MSQAKAGALEHFDQRCSKSTRLIHAICPRSARLAGRRAELIACAERQGRGTDASVEFVRLTRTNSTLGA